MDQQDEIIKQSIQQADSQYNADWYLAEVVKLLYKNKKLKIEIVAHEWDVSQVDKTKLIFKLWYNADGHEVVLNILESVFRDYDRKADSTIGIKQTMSLRNKVILRLAYLLYTHKDD